MKFSPFTIIDLVSRRKEIIHSAAQKIGLSKTWPVSIFYDAIFRWPLAAVEAYTAASGQRKMAS